MSTSDKSISMNTMRAKLSTLWTFLMFNMVYADIFSFMYPGFMKQIVEEGSAEGTPITPVLLLIAAIVTEISIAMVFLPRFLNYRANRWANIIGGIITILWVVGGGSLTLHYIFFATLESICALGIIWMAWNWRMPANQAELRRITMKAAVYTDYGPPDVLHLAEVAQPTPKDNEVLIRVHTSTVTSGDCNMRGFTFVPRGFGLMSRLAFGYRHPKKTILGVEFAGEIAAVGKDVTLFQKGAPVFGLDGAGIGAYAEYKCMAETGGLTLKPANLTFEEAVAIPNGALTALTLLRNLAHLQPGQHVLIVGASGSVGSAAVQIAKYLGADVTGVCSTANLELVTSLGADKVIDYTHQDFTQGRETYDIIFDTVAKSSFSACKSVLKPKGCYLAGAGGVAEFAQMLWTSIVGGKKVIAGMSSEQREDLEFIKGLVEAGHLKPVIDRVYPLKNIAEAHRYVDAGHKKGNVVIIIA